MHYAWCLSLWVLTHGTVFAEPVWRNLGPGGGGWIQPICASLQDARDSSSCQVGGGLAPPH